MVASTISLDQLLSLVGELNDQAGDDTPRDRFRNFLSTSVTSVGTVRDYVETCLGQKGDQYNRALQDLVNHAGALMGFDVEFGRYSGVTNQVGHDGLWRTGDFSIVIEVKTSDAFAIQTATLLGYINKLIDERRIDHVDRAMGLYVFGKPERGISQLEAAISHGGHAHHLRIATVDDILTLAELVQQNLLSLEEALTLLRPTGVRVGATVQILQRIAAGHETVTGQLTTYQQKVESAGNSADSVHRRVSETGQEESTMYLLTPVASDEGVGAEEIIRSLLDQGVYVFGDRTPGRTELKPGDKIAFYESGNGVVACAEVASRPERKPVHFAKRPDKFPWSFKVRNVRYFFDDPVVIDASVRSRLDRFADKDPQGAWGWFVQGTRRISQHDFRILTRQED